MIAFPEEEKLDQFLKGQRKMEGIKLKRSCHGEEQAQCWTAGGMQGDAESQRENTAENTHLESTSKE